MNNAYKVKNADNRYLALTDLQQHTITSKRFQMDTNLKVQGFHVKLHGYGGKHTNFGKIKI